MTSFNKLEAEKNKFIRDLNQEQFDAVLTKKYKKAFHDYFNGVISDSELSEKVNRNMDLISIYESGDGGKIDANQYLYHAIVDVALNYYNVANGFETCLNKVCLLASYFQLCATFESKLMFLNDLIYDVFFINEHLDNNADGFLDRKLTLIVDVADGLNDILNEISKHEDVISTVENESKNSFLDELLIDDSVKEMFNMFHDSANKCKCEFKSLVDSGAVGNNGATLNIITGNLIGGADG